jgi:hypothetical protein
VEFPQSLVVTTFYTYPQLTSIASHACGPASDFKDTEAAHADPVAFFQVGHHRRHEVRQHPLRLLFRQCVGLRELLKTAFSVTTGAATAFALGAGVAPAFLRATRSWRFAATFFAGAFLAGAGRLAIATTRSRLHSRRNHGFCLAAKAFRQRDGLHALTRCRHRG